MPTTQTQPPTHRRIATFLRSAGIPEETFVDRTRRERHEAESAPGAFRIFSAAVSSEHVLPQLARWWQRSAFEADASYPGLFALPVELRNELLEGVAPQYWPGLYDAVSLDHARLLADQMRELTRNEALLAQAGWGGLTARMAAAVVDPVVLASAVLTGGATAAYSTAGRMGKVVRAGFIAAGENAAIEAFVGQTDPTRGAKDVLYAGLAGAVLGGGFVSLGEAYRAAALRSMKRLEYTDVVDAAAAAGKTPDQVLSDSGKAYFKEETGPTPSQRVRHAMALAEHLGLDLGETAELRAAIDAGDVSPVLDAAMNNPDVARLAPDEGDFDPFYSPETDELVRQAARSAERESGSDIEEVGLLAMERPPVTVEARFTGIPYRELQKMGVSELDAVHRKLGLEPIIFRGADKRSQRKELLAAIHAEQRRRAGLARQTPASERGLSRQFGIADVNTRLEDYIKSSGMFIRPTDVLEEQVEAAGHRMRYGGTLEAQSLAITPDEWKDLTPAQRLRANNAGVEVNEDKATELIQSIGDKAYRALKEQVIYEEAGDFSREALDEILDPRGPHPPDVRLLAYMKKSYDEMQPEDRRAAAARGKVLTRADRLPEGYEVEILGETFTVRKTQGMTTLEDGIELHFFGDETIPIDKGSVKPGPDAQAPPFSEGQKGAPGPEYPLREPYQPEGTPPAGTGGQPPLFGKPPKPPAPPPPKERGDFFPRALAAMSRFTPVRWSMAARIGALASPIARMLGSVLVTDAVVKAGGAVQRVAASAWTHMQTRVRLGEYWRGVDTHWRQYAADHGITNIFSVARRDGFLQEVGRAKRRLDNGTLFDPTVDPSVKALAELQWKLEKDLVQLARRHGVKGFLDLPEADPGYLPRLWDRSAIRKLDEQVGRENVERLIAKALLDGSDDLSQEMAPVIARRMLTVLDESDRFSMLEQAQVLSGERAELVRQVLSDIPGMQPGDLEAALSALTRKAKDPATLTQRTRRRASMDETARIVVTDRAGVERTIGVEDMLVNNAGQLMNHYTRQVVGASAMAEVLRVMGDQMGRTFDNYNELLSAVRSAMTADNIAPAKAEKAVERFQTIGRAIQGRPIGNDTAFAGMLRMMRLTNHVLMSGAFGWAQLPDFAVSVASAGMRATLQQMPVLASVFRRAADGDLSNPLLRELETIWGIGTNAQLDQITSRFDHGDSVVEFGGGRLETLLRQGARFANHLSLMTPITVLQKRWAGALAAQKFADIAWSGRPLSARRLQSLGLTPPQADAISASIRAHGAFQEGVFGRRILKTNIDSWSDKDAAAAFIGAIDRWSGRVVQDVDIGNMALWMTTDMGRMLAQYRSFTLTAWEKQFLNNLAMHDWQTFMEFSTSMMVAGVGYVAQSYAQSAGLSDREKRKFLRDRLGRNDGQMYEKVGRAAFQRAGFTSITPDLFDMGNTLLGGEPLFNYRNSGLSTARLRVEGLLSNPTFSTVSALGTSFAQAVKGLRDDDEKFTQADGRQAIKVVPFHRLIGVSNFLEHMVRKLPEDN